MKWWCTVTRKIPSVAIDSPGHAPQSLKLQKTSEKVTYIATVHTLGLTTYLQEEEKNTIYLNEIKLCQI